MADITVRNIRFSFDEPIDFDVSPEELGRLLGAFAVSLTMPYLEPYLIRTMKVARKQITNPVLAEDALRFSQQEGHHFRNHALLNDQIRRQFGSETVDGLQRVEAALEADYQRFSRQRTLRFNAVYAEGFEAMTCAGALAAAEHRTFDEGSMPIADLFNWHMAEEIEHRTVAFDVYQHLVGSYFYRIVAGTWSQWHYVSFVGRFMRCMAAGLDRKPKRERDPAAKTLVRNYLRTWSPFYDPAKIPMPDGVQELLDRYSAVAHP